MTFVKDRFASAEKKKLMLQTFVVGNIFKQLQSNTVIRPVVISIVFFWLLPRSHAQVPEGPDTVTVSSGVYC
jgi:hypothetical protein